MKTILLIIVMFAVLKCFGQTHADTVITWENNTVSFNNADIKTIMGTVSVLYKVNIIYAGKIPEITFLGGITPGTTLPELIKSFQLLGIHCKLTGKTIIVSP
jgi:transmembrane sensor